MSIQAEEMQPQEKLGDFIARVRTARGMTIEQLSDEIKLGVSYVKAIEAGDWKVFPVAAYVRGYLRSIGHKLNMNVEQMLDAYNAECGGSRRPVFDAGSSDKIKLSPLKEGEIKKKSYAVPVVLVLLVLAFLVASHFLDLESIALNQSGEAQPVEKKPVVVEETVATQEIPDGAEAVPVDSLAAVDSTAKDSAAKPSEANATVSQAVVDEAVKKSDLPASATIFISSDSKKEEQPADNEAPKTNKTNFVLIGSGESLSWVGLKRREDSNAFLKEANISRAGVRMVYNTNDTLCVTIGDPTAIAKMLLNGVETPLPEMKFGRVTRFRVYGGKIVK